MPLTITSLYPINVRSIVDDAHGCIPLTEPCLLQAGETATFELLQFQDGPRWHRTNAPLTPKN